jgi:biopolymer transport protein ExbD
MARKLSSIVGSSEDCKMDASSMIDMVFQLLIFFMVSARLITNQIDPKVLIPVADGAKPPEAVAGRIVLNIYMDGTFSREDRSPLPDSAAITDYLRSRLEQLPKDTPPKLLLRGDRESLVRYAKQAVQSAGKVGMSTIIFAAYPTAVGTRRAE